MSEVVVDPEKSSAINWLTAAAIKFQQTNTHPKNEFGVDMGARALESGQLF